MDRERLKENIKDIFRIVIGLTLLPLALYYLFIFFREHSDALFVFGGLGAYCFWEYKEQKRKYG